MKLVCVISFNMAIFCIVQKEENNFLKFFNTKCSLYMTKRPVMYRTKCYFFVIKMNLLVIITSFGLGNDYGHNNSRY